MEGSADPLREANLALLLVGRTFQLFQFFYFRGEKTLVSCLLSIEFPLPFSRQVFFDSGDLRAREGV